MDVHKTKPMERLFDWAYETVIMPFLSYTDKNGLSKKDVNLLRSTLGSLVLLNLDNMIFTCQDFLSIAPSQSGNDIVSAQDKKSMWVDGFFSGAWYSQNELIAMKLNKAWQEVIKKAPKKGWEKAKEEVFQHWFTNGGIINLLDQHCVFDDHRQQGIERMMKWAESEAMKLCKEYKENPWLSSHKMFCADIDE